MPHYLRPFAVISIRLSTSDLQTKRRFLTSTILIISCAILAAIGRPGIGQAVVAISAIPAAARMNLDIINVVGRAFGTKSLIEVREDRRRVVGWM